MVSAIASTRLWKRSGQVRSGQGRSGQGRAGQGRAGQGRAGRLPGPSISYMGFYISSWSAPSLRIVCGRGQVRSGQVRSGQVGQESDVRSHTGYTGGGMLIARHCPKSRIMKKEHQVIMQSVNKFRSKSMWLWYGKGQTVTGQVVGYGLRLMC